MPKQDFSNYEKRLAIDHEQRCRTILSVHFAWKVCKIRKCGRDQVCTGPMLVSAHQDRKVRIQREIGLSRQRLRQPAGLHRQGTRRSPPALRGHHGRLREIPDRISRTPACRNSTAT